jgi:type IV secretion system protein VirD4
MSNEYDRFGSAKWASAGDIHKAKLGKLSKHSVFCGFNPYANKPLMLGGDGHVTIIGGAGAGKGAGLLMYSALGFGWHGSSIINDLKGEIAACTIHNLHKQGKKGYCINPFGLHGDEPWHLPQHRINPLDILKPDSLTLTADITLIFEMLIKVSGDNKNSYFEDKARLWCCDITQYIILATGKVSLPDIYEIICMAETQPDYFARFAKGEMMTLGVSNIARTAMEMVNKRIEAPREYSAIMGTIIKNLAWLDDPAMNEAVSHADFSLNDLLDKQTQIYIILPAEYVAQYSTFLRLIIGVGMIVKSRKPQSDPVLFI